MKQLLRHIAPIFLLASFMPITIISSLHIHNDTIDTLDNCRQCLGHFENHHHHHHDCPYCNILSLNYIIQPTVKFALPQWNTATEPDLANDTIISYCYGTSLLRAPPLA